jgi:hypothetical protein
VTVSVPALAERALRRLNVRVVPLDDSPIILETVPFDTIATNVLVELGVIASDETPSDVDQALALEKVASVHASLDAQALVWWAAETVPRAFAEEYTKLAVAMTASSFGKSVDPNIVAMLEARVRKGAMTMASHDIAVEAVMGVHNMLAGRGLARWTSDDIPDYAAMPYEILAAAEMAPKFGVQVNPNGMLQAMQMLVAAIALPTSGERIVAEYF